MSVPINKLIIFIFGFRSFPAEIGGKFLREFAWFPFRSSTSRSLSSLNSPNLDFDFVRRPKIRVRRTRTQVLTVELEGPFGRYSAISSQHRSVRTKSGVNVVTMMDLDLLEVLMFFDFSVFEFRRRKLLGRKDNSLACEQRSR